MYIRLRYLNKNKLRIANYRNPLLHIIKRLLPCWPGFDTGSVHVGLAADKVALRQVFAQIFRFSPVSFIPSMLHYTEKQKK
jgi:hypothetical protein